MKRLTANAGLLAKIVGPRTNAKKPRKKEIARNQKLLLIVVKCVALSRGGTKLSYALSFYRSQNVLGWSKFFAPVQKFIYILWQSQTFCARQKHDLHSVKLVFVTAQKFLKRQ